MIIISSNKFENIQAMWIIPVEMHMLKDIPCISYMYMYDLSFLSPFRVHTHFYHDTSSS